MFDINRLVGLIEERNKLCREYEACSEEMLTCPYEEMADKLKRRSEIAKQIDAVNAVIKEMHEPDAEDGGTVRKAVDNSCDRSDLPDEYRKLFDMAQAGFASLNRVMNNEPLIAERMKMRKMQLDKKIRSMKNTSGILSYLKTGVSTRDGGSRFREEI